MQRGTSPFTPEFDDLVNSLLAKWHVPGTSIAIIDGPDTFTKGYGISKYPNTPATPKTLYYTASTTKSFTAAALSLLIDDESQPLTWTTPLSTIIRSDFVLPDAYATEHITLEDALSHRTGLPEHSYHFRPDNSSTPKDEVRRFCHLPMTAAIRAKYMYNSFMYTAVSHAIETLTGRDLGVFLRERIWGPLHMDATYWTLRDAVDSRPDELAGAYVWDDAFSSSFSSSSSSSGFVEIDYPEYTELSGAGCMISSVEDYAKWVRCMMDQSRPLSRDGHAALVEPRVVSMTGATNPFPGPHLYALGWRVDYYRGEKVVWHTGSIGGFGSVMMFLPGRDRDWGLVIMGNSTVTSNQMQQVLYMDLLDGLLGTPVEERVDWGAVITEKKERRREELACVRNRLYPGLPCPVLKPTLEVREYAGSYWHPGYGAMDLRLDVEGKGLVADRRSQEFSMMIVLEHVSGEFWLAKLQEKYKDSRDHEVVRAEFRLGPEGVREVGVDLEPTMDGELIWFRRVK